ncbi:MAG: hypothetical protein ACTSSK_07760 [Candidatus Heimdallarchaeota archaeon]
MTAKKTKTFKKEFFLIAIFLLVIIFLLTSSPNSSFDMNEQVQNEFYTDNDDNSLIGNKLDEKNEALTSNGLKRCISVKAMDDCCFTIQNIKNPLKPTINQINDLEKFLTYFFISAALIIVPIFCIVYYVIYPVYTKKKAMKELEVSKQLDDSEKMSGPITDLTRIYDKKIVYNILSIGLVSFFVQNLLALIIFSINGAIGSWTSNTDWYYYLWNIPLILDLVVGLIFTIGFLVAYCSTKNKKTMITSIFWILWLIFSIAYRVLLGMPSFKYLIDTSETDNLYRMYLIGIFFAVSQVLFWFAIFMTDLSLRIPNQRIFSRIIIFGTVNYLIGILLAFLVTFMDMSMNTDEAFFLVIILYIPTIIFKFIVPPIVGMVSIFSLYRGIKKDYATNCI